MSKRTVKSIGELIETVTDASKKVELLAELDALQPENLPIETIKPYYDVTNNGVFHYSVQTNSGKTEHTRPLWLCGCFYLIGRGQDKHKDHYCIIRWKDKYDGRDRTDALPMEIVGTSKCWQYLRKRGIAVSSNRRCLELLTDYIQKHCGNDRWHITDKVGWHGKAYILPSGELLSDADSHVDKIMYQGDTSQADYFTQSGSLKDWQKQIGRYVSGNSRLLLAMGASFSAPLLYLLGGESGGFHFFSDSSDGKTIMTRTALSVWGHGKNAMVQWNGTTLAFENASLARNDCLIVLDEMRQANERTIAHTAYSLFNGQGKMQGAKEGGNRPVNQWRILALSTGERAMQTFLSDMYAGQAVRLPDIPANAGKGLGVYDTLHGYAGGAALSEHLDEASQKQYGSAGKTFIQALIRDTQAKKTVQVEIDSFLKTLPELEGQARRIGKRFALAAAALILATGYGVLNLTREDIHTGIKTCFDAWEKEAGGLGKREDREILEQTRDWFTPAAHSRFDNITDDVIPHSSPNSAGYREILADGKTVYYMFPKVFKAEIVKNFQKTKVCEVLYQNKWLIKERPNGYQSRRQIGNERYWFYKFIGAQPPCMDEPDQSEPPNAGIIH